MKKFSEWLEERDPEFYNESVMGWMRGVGKKVMPYVAGAAMLGMGLGMGGKAHAGEPAQGSYKPAITKTAMGGDGGVDNLEQLKLKAEELIKKKANTPTGTKEYEKINSDTENAINDYLNAKKAQESGGGAGMQKTPQPQPKPQPKIDDGKDVKKVQPNQPAAGGEQEKVWDMLSPEWRQHKKDQQLLYDDACGIGQEILNHFTMGTMQELVDSHLDTNDAKKASNIFGDKVVDSYVKAALGNVPAANDGVKVSLLLELQKIDPNANALDVLNSIKMLKQNPSILDNIIKMCEEKVKKPPIFNAGDKLKNKANTKVFTDYVKWKISLLKQLQQGLAN
jgi:hypothetical protein